MTFKPIPFHSFSQLQKKISVFGCIFSLILLLQTQKAHAQVRPSLSIGFGLPELVCIGVNFPFEQVQFGVSYGMLRWSAEDFPMTSLSGDIRYYFAEKSQFTERNAWYCRLALSVFRTENNKYINEYTYLSPKIGREINFSKRFGVELDLGAAFEVQHNQIRKTPPSLFEFGFLEFPVLPAASACLIYRLK